MLSIFLTILKIIGLILLLILGLVLVILLAVLLVPIKYEAEAAMAENKPTAKARVSWLLRFLCVRVRFGEDGLHYLVKVCGFSVLDSDKPKIEKNQKQKTAKKETQKDASTETAVEKADEIKTSGEIKASEDIKRIEEVKSLDVKTESKSTDTGKNEDLKSKSEKKKDKKKKQDKQNSDKETKSLQEKLEDLKTKKDEISGKIQNIKEKVDEVLTYLQSPEGRNLTAFLKRKLFRLLRHLKPKALRINGRIGLADPATTGTILGISYMLYPVYGEHIHLTGEFEEEVIEGDFYIKGRIRLGTLLLIVIQIILNKEVRMWIKKATGGNRK